MFARLAAGNLITPQNLGIIIDGTTYTVNLTGSFASNTAVITAINAALGSVATAELWNLANEEFMDTDNVMKLVNLGSAPISAGMVVSDYVGGIQISATTSMKPCGVCLDNTPVGGTARILIQGLIYISAQAKASDFSHRWVVNSAALSGIGSTYNANNGTLAAATNGIFTYVAYNIVKVN